MPIPQNRNKEAAGGMIPPQAQPVRRFTTPSVADGFFAERVDVSGRDYIPLARGTLYSTIKNAEKSVIDQFPTLYFLKETLDPFYYPWALRLWSTNEDAESTYNAEITYLNENVAYPSYSRVYTLKRDEYEASPAITPGTPFTGILGVRVDNGGSGYTKDDVVNFSSGDAAAVLVVDSAGVIIGIVMTNEGSGYDSASPPTVSIPDPQASGAGVVLTALMQDKAAVLTSQKKVELPDDDPLGQEKVRVIRVYETLPGPFDYSTRLDSDGIVVATGTRRNIATNIASGENASSNIWTKRTKKGDQNSYVADEIVETRALPGNSIPSFLIGQDLYGSSTGKVLEYSSDIYGSVSESGGVLTTVEKKEVTEAVSEKITTSKTWLDDADYSITIPNVIPQWARALIPTRTVSHKVKGSASQPTLGIGEFTRAEKTLDAIFKRVTVESLNFDSLPVILSNQGLTEKFGGSVTQIQITINVSGSLTIDQGLIVIDSKIDQLGNGMEVKTTEAAIAPWEVLYGQEYDEGLDVVIPFAEQTITEGTEQGAAKTDIRTEDIWRSKKRTIDAAAAETVLGAYVMAYPSKINISMPNKLVSLTSQIESRTGDGAHSEVGSVAGYGSYSINLDLNSQATASASIIPEVIPIVKQFYGANIDCTHYIFFLPNPVTSAQVITKINALIAGTVATWPKFNPETVNLLIIGGDAALEVKASSKGSYSQAADLSSQSSTAGGGTGYSRGKGLTIRRMQIDDVIHGDLTVVGTTTDTVDLNAYCQAEATGLGPFEEVNQTDTINAFTSPTSFSATAGATDWPAAGKFLNRVDGRPYKYGFVMFHAIVVDASDFPSNV